MRVTKKNLRAALASDDGELLNRLISTQTGNFLDKIFPEYIPISGRFFRTLKIQYPKFVIPVLIKLAMHPDVLMNNSIYNPNAMNIIGHFEAVIRCSLDGCLGPYGDNEAIGALLEAILHAPLSDNQAFIAMFNGRIGHSIETIHYVHSSFISPDETMSSSIYCDKLYAKIAKDPEIFKALIRTKYDLDVFCKTFEKDRDYNRLHDKAFKEDYAQIARERWWNFKNTTLHYGSFYNRSGKQSVVKECSSENQNDLKVLVEIPSYKGWKGLK